MSGTANNPIERIAFNVRDFTTQPLFQNFNDIEPASRFADFRHSHFRLRPIYEDARLPKPAGVSEAVESNHCERAACCGQR
jgi:hypothetical protein